MIFLPRVMWPLGVYLAYAEDMLRMRLGRGVRLLDFAVVVEAVVVGLAIDRWGDDDVFL